LVPWSRIPGEIAYSYNGTGGSALYLIDAGRQDVRLLASVRPDTLSFINLAWMPGGRIAYSQFVPNVYPYYSLWALTPDEGAPQLLYSDGDAAAWSRDGRLAAACIDETLCLDPPATVSLRVAGEVIGTRPAFDPDGAHLVVSLVNVTNPVGPDGLYIIDFQSGSLSLLKAAASDSELLGDPTFSPDGSKLAFSTGFGGSPESEVWVMDVDGTNAVRLTSGHSDVQPSWSPDGTEIAFVRDGGVWLMYSDGSSVAQITDGAAVSIAWHP
jgi:hypothetical protein